MFLDHFRIQRNVLHVELDDGVAGDVTHVDQSSLDEDVGVLPLHKPADMSEEKAPLHVVRVGVRLRELVVHTMVSNPIVKSILKKLITNSKKLSHNKKIASDKKVVVLWIFALCGRTKK